MPAAKGLLCSRGAGSLKTQRVGDPPRDLVLGPAHKDGVAVLVSLEDASLREPPVLLEAVDCAPRDSCSGARLSRTQKAVFRKGVRHGRFLASCRQS